MLSKQELEDIWENKPYGYFAKKVKTMKGKTKYRILTVAYKTVEEVLGEEEAVVWAKDSKEAVSSINHDASVQTLRRKLSLPTWEPKVRYVTKCIGLA